MFFLPEAMHKMPFENFGQHFADYQIEASEDGLKVVSICKKHVIVVQ